MGFHTYDADRAEALENPERYEYLSVDELLALFDPGPEAMVADFGSGTGFSTDAIAPYVDRVVAVDIQPEMHAIYHQKGLPATVQVVTAPVATLPFPDSLFDGAFSTMTFHEFADEQSLAEIHRVLAPGARLGIGDWTATGAGETGPPLSERFAVEDAVDALSDAGFAIEYTNERRETFVVRTRRDRPP